MPIQVLMPALSPTMEEGTLAKWLVKEGDAISSGDVIAEIETDKATMEVESIDEGTMGKIMVAEGTEGVSVNSLIAVILEDGETADDIDLSASAVPAAASNSAAAAEQPSAAPEDVQSNASPDPQISKELSSGNIDDNSIEEKKNFSSPLARRIAKNAGIDIALVSGTGPRGRVIKRDVEAAITSGTATAPAPTKAKDAPKAASAPAPASDDQTLKLFDPESYEAVPHDAMRRTIARRLIEAKQTVPHFYLTIDCEIDALLALRKQINDAAPEIDGKPAYKISVNDLVIKAHANALAAIPNANASWTDEAMLKHKHADVGVAVSIPGGLITPIIRKADQKTLSAISNEMRDLASRARERKLKPEEFQGGTSAVSNLGMFGIKDFCAVINPPHATILAVGAGRQEAVIRDGAVAVATIMSVTLSTDHRAVDGALGAELLGAFKNYIENPMGMLV